MNIQAPDPTDCPQKRFAAEYMTSSEICQIVGITKAAITKAIARGQLPRPIFVNCQFNLWERKTVMPHIQAWKEKVKS